MPLLSARPVSYVLFALGTRKTEREREEKII